MVEAIVIMIFCFLVNLKTHFHCLQTRCMERYKILGMVPFLVRNWREVASSFMGGGQVMHAAGFGFTLSVHCDQRHHVIKDGALKAFSLQFNEVTVNALVFIALGGCHKFWLYIVCMSSSTSFC